MMYSQQEYEMVRRQTIQIEAEKRAVLRWAFRIALGVIAVLAAAAIWLFSQYATADNKIEAAEARAVKAENDFKKVSTELAEKKAILDKQAATAAQQNQTVTSLVPKAVSGLATDFELATLAHAIFESRTDHKIELPRIPPDSILRRYRYRVGAEVHSYVLIAGQLNDQWVLYSNLVGKGIPPPVAPRPAFPRPAAPRPAAPKV
jgi:Tfp pilus assembly major pilin PilA